MQISKFREQVNFRTPYNEKYDLIQKYRGVAEGNFGYNNTVDNIETGLVLREKWDYWHSDVPLSISTDEAPPMTVNGTYIGANHGFSGAVGLYLPGHDKTLADVGSHWKDAEGTLWTLLTANEDVITLISENIGESEVRYDFKRNIEGTLIYVSGGEHTSDIVVGAKSFQTAMRPVNRHTKRRVVAYKDGQAKVVYGEESCDYAEIQEEYDVVNPVSMARALHENRPEGGYTAIPQAMGDAMIKCRYIYRIEADGTVVIDFSYEKLQDVHLKVCMGAMYQEKLDVYGGGIYRYIPKILPFETPEGSFDFSVPVSTDYRAPFPKVKYIKADCWENPMSPPDKIVDILRDSEGHDRLGFVCGYLPIYDGVPKKRIPHLETAIHIVRTRKGYPFFMSGDLTKMRGVAYKKYFVPERDNAVIYTIPYEGKKYIYMDFFQEATLSVAVEGTVKLYEKSEAISYEVKDGMLSARGTKGYAVFICEG